MMNRIKTARVQLLRFLFLLPLAAVLLLAFRNEVLNAPSPLPIVTSDTLPRYSVNVITPKGIPYAIASNENGEEVSRIPLSPKPGSSDKEKADFEISLKKWEQKYGLIPPPPPPSQPLPPSPPRISVAPPEPPPPVTDVVVTGHQVPVAPAGVIIPQNLPDNIESLGLVTQQVKVNGHAGTTEKTEVTITYKNGKKVTEDISTPEKKKFFDEKYGIKGLKLIPAPGKNIVGVHERNNDDLQQIKVTGHRLKAYINEGDTQKDSIFLIADTLTIHDPDQKKITIFTSSSSRMPVTFTTVGTTTHVDFTSPVSVSGTTEQNIETIKK